MRINVTALQAAAFAAALLSAGAARADSSPLGMWIDHTGRGGVEITECGGKICGHIAWLKDSKNAEACGEQVLGDVKSVGGGKWDKGWIYDPDTSSKYDVELTLLGDTLRVMGYAGTKWLSETYTWKRAPSDLQKCSKSGSAAEAPAAAKIVTGSVTAAAVKTAVKTEAKQEIKTEAKTEAKPETKTQTKPQTKTAAAKVDSEDEFADETENETADETGDKTADEKAEKASPDLAEVVSNMFDDGDTGSGKSKSGPKRMCKMDVPYLEMKVSYPCED